MWSEHAFILMAALGGAVTFGVILEQDVRDKAMDRANILGKIPPHPVWTLFLYCMILVMLAGSALIGGAAR